MIARGGARVAGAGWVAKRGKSQAGGNGVESGADVRPATGIAAGADAQACRSLPQIFNYPRRGMVVAG